MAKLPRPLVPKTADVRQYPFMPLDVNRLRDSALTATTTDAEFRAAVLLWCAAWHQVPAGSLPDDDRQLAVLSLCGRSADAFRELRDGALYGFIKCADGRLYHPVICEKVKEALGRTAAGKSGANSRWKNKKPGNAAAKRTHSDSTSGRNAKDKDSNSNNTPLNPPASGGTSCGQKKQCEESARANSRAHGTSPRQQAAAKRGTVTHLCRFCDNQAIGTTYNTPHCRDHAGEARRQPNLGRRFSTEAAVSALH